MMMKTSRTRFWWSIISGFLLVTAGVIFLLVNFNLITLNWEVLIGPLFGVGGLVFLLVFLLNTDDWWALIPGFVLTGLGTIIFMSISMEDVGDQWAGAIFLGFISLAFLLIYFFHNEHWWAVIPGGVLFTLAIVSLLSENDLLSGGIFFLGMALTFGLIYILPKPTGKAQWALYPAVILLLIGIMVTLGAVNLINYVWSVGLLIVGGYLILRELRK
jgi:hypothetical protein